MRELISVIVPIYNVELYLEECINSIVSQTYRNIEIILVDDGSTDCSGAICEKYAKKDDRIKVIHQKNAGVSAARNNAINIATGQYVAFVDSDDYIDSNYLVRLYSLLREYNADISICRFRYAFGKSEQPKDGEHSIFVYNKLDALKMLLIEKEFGSYPHQKLFKTEIVKKHLYPEGKIYEDVATTYKYFGEADRIVYTRERLYIYRQRLGSIITGAYTSKNKFDILDALDDMQIYFNKNYPEIAEYVLIPKIFYYLHTLARLPDDKKMYPDQRKRVIGFLKENRIKALKFHDMPKSTKEKILLSYLGERIYKIVWKAQKSRLNKKIKI